MSHHILAVYDNPNEASLAADRLEACGIPKSAISVVASEGYRSKYLGVTGGTKGGQGVATGATLGGALGAVAAGLAATGTVVATGGGALLVAGPIAAALAGAGAGGTTGGILGGLIGLGISDHHIKSYDKAVNDSRGMLLGVEVNDTTKDQARDILKATGGKSISLE